MKEKIMAKYIKTIKYINGDLMHIILVKDLHKMKGLKNNQSVKILQNICSEGIVDMPFLAVFSNNCIQTFFGFYIKTNLFSVIDLVKIRCVESDLMKIQKQAEDVINKHIDKNKKIYG